MAKYDPIARFLRRRRTAEEILSFADIERMIGGLLPKRARVAAWWSGAAEGAAAASAWRGVGYEAQLIAPESVRFQRQPTSAVASAASGAIGLPKAGDEDGVYQPAMGRRHTNRK